MGHSRSDEQRRALKQLVESALLHLKGLGYSERTQRYCWQVWNAVLQFACGTSSRSKRIRTFAADFLASRGIRPGNTRRFSWCQMEARQRLRVLIEFQETGTFRRHPKRIEELLVPPAFDRARQHYELFCTQQLGHQPTTLAGRRRILTFFFAFLSTRGVKSAKGICAPLLTAFFIDRARHIGPGSLATELGSIRSFLRFLAMRGVIAAELVAHVKGTRVAKEHRLPPVWPAQSVAALLAAVDRSSSVGKRNYAVLLLASRLGLRACDIRALELDDLLWTEDRISLTQKKTGRVLSLPIGDELGAALIDYLRNARPRVACRTVFLKSRAPHEPLGTSGSLRAIVGSTARRAGIVLPPGVPFGTHSLRHTLATHLVKAGRRLETVAGILGHASIESTRVYTHLDVATLRCVALDPDRVLYG